MVFEWLADLLFDEKNRMSRIKKENLERAKKILREKGIPVPTNSTKSVPDFFADKRDAMNYFHVVREDITDQNTMKKLFSDKFSIGTRDPYNYAERKRMPIISPDNPFTTDEGEGERLVIDWVMGNKDKLIAGAAGAVGAARRGGMTQCCGACQLKGRGGMKHGGMMGCRRGIGRF
jgi:hypothetical protein